MSKGTFKKGHKPWNKDLKGIHLSKDSEFKKGQYVGEGHPSWKGGVQTPKSDCAHLYSGVGKRIRRPRKVYEDAYGEIPKGFIIYHKDGNKDNDDPGNLEAISRGELMKRNSNKNC